MTHMATLGVFSQPSYITIGDPYDKRILNKSKDEKKPDRHGGKQFLTSPPKRGKVGKGVYFEDTFKPLLEGDKYQDPGTHEREYQKKNKLKNISQTPFRPSSPPKKSTGLGGWYGCIGKQFPHMTEYDVVQKGASPKKHTPGPKNILTSPPRKGTYGFPGTTIGKYPEYMSDPYDAAREKALEEKKKLKEKKVSEKPFKSMSRSLDFFDSYPNVAASRIYTIDYDKLPKPRKKKEEQKKKIEKPFKPSSPPKVGYDSYFTKFPEYMSDPYVKKVERKKEEDKAKPIFKPTSGPKSTPTKSILFFRTSHL